jgi:pimeloyl-ACP methyl ester carboxylesterase
MARRALAAALVGGVLAAGLAGCGSAAPTPAVTSHVVSVPVEIANTADGAVAYRMFGHGPPLVMVMGYAGTMETWDPLLVDVLARHFRVVTFDNAGIGSTGAAAAPLSIDAMADQTSALISALQLHRPYVLGWSMGGMVAQALAVRHARQVRGLVLCASFPGDGAATIPRHGEVAALTSDNAARTAAALFPADQEYSSAALSAELERYPADATASSATIAAQAHASLQWFHGRDAAGRETSRIVVPTLVADGEEDRLDAPRNDRELARLIHGSTLLMLPDAGHAFLFQDSVAFASRVESFLGRRASRHSVASIRSRFRVYERRLRTSGVAWVRKLRSASKRHSSSVLAAADATYAGVLATQADRLLDAGATGHLAANVVMLAAADQSLVDDIAGLSDLTRSSGLRWGARTRRDGARAEVQIEAIERQLGLPVGVGSNGARSTRAARDRRPARSRSRSG